MGEELKHGQATGHGDFEREDLSAPTVFWSLVGLAAVCILIAFIVIGMYRSLDRKSEASQPPQNPLVTAPAPDSRTETKTQFRAEIKSTFPEPRLEEDERDQLNDVRLNEERELNSYGWVNEKAGVVHIPIERAMQLVEQRGLPVLPQGADATTRASKAPAKDKTPK
jgi:hypothetical protein